MAEMLSTQFSSVFTTNSNQVLNKDELFPAQQMDLNDIEINPDVFIKTLTELSPQAMTGPGGMPAILLHNCKEIYARTLTILWQNVFNHEMTPTITT